MIIIYWASKLRLFLTPVLPKIRTHFLNSNCVHCIALATLFYFYVTLCFSHSIPGRVNYYSQSKEEDIVY